MIAVRMQIQNGRGKETKREIEEKREALNIGSEESK